LVGDIVALAMMPLGMIAALLRHGDFIKVVARKAN